jgi:hypothetical protein
MSDKVKKLTDLRDKRVKECKQHLEECMRKIGKNDKDHIREFCKTKK